MPLFMDVHHSIPEGAGPADVAEAHAADQRIRAQCGVEYKNYWLDEAAGKVFCLVEAPMPRPQQTGSSQSRV